MFSTLSSFQRFWLFAANDMSLDGSAGLTSDEEEDPLVAAGLSVSVPVLGDIACRLASKRATSDTLIKPTAQTTRQSRRKSVATATITRESEAAVPVKRSTRRKSMGVLSNPSSADTTLESSSSATVKESGVPVKRSYRRKSIALTSSISSSTDTTLEAEQIHSKAAESSSYTSIVSNNSAQKKTKEIEKDEQKSKSNELKEKRKSTPKSRQKRERRKSVSFAETDSIQVYDQISQSSTEGLSDCQSYAGTSGWQLMNPKPKENEENTCDKDQEDYLYLTSLQKNTEKCPLSNQNNNNVIDDSKKVSLPDNTAECEPVKKTSKEVSKRKLMNIDSDPCQLLVAPTTSSDKPTPAFVAMVKETNEKKRGRKRKLVSENEQLVSVEKENSINEGQGHAKRSRLRTSSGSRNGQDCDVDTINNTHKTSVISEKASDKKNNGKSLDFPVYISKKGCQSMLPPNVDKCVSNDDVEHNTMLPPTNMITKATNKGKTCKRSADTDQVNNSNITVETRKSPRNKSPLSYSNLHNGITHSSPSGKTSESHSKCTSNSNVVRNINQTDNVDDSGLLTDISGISTHNSMNSTNEGGLGMSMSAVFGDTFTSQALRAPPRPSIDEFNLRTQLHGMKKKKSRKNNSLRTLVASSSDDRSTSDSDSGSKVKPKQKISDYNGQSVLRRSPCRPSIVMTSLHSQ